MKKLFAVLLVTLTLAGCGTLNTFNGAAINTSEQDYAGFRKNLQATDDMAFIGWNDAACNIKVGALARNATGNPLAVQAVLEACHVPGVAVIQAGSISMTIPTPAKAVGQ